MNEQFCNEEHIKKLKDAATQLNNFINNNEFWDNLNTFKKSKIEFIPVEIWETDTRYYVLLYLAGNQKEDRMQMYLKEEQTLYVKVEYVSLRPTWECSLVQSEFPKSLERNILLPRPAKEILYFEYNNGTLNIVLTKNSE